MGLSKSLRCQIITRLPLQCFFLLGLASISLAQSPRPFLAYPDNLSTLFSRDVALTDRFTQKESTFAGRTKKTAIDLSFGRPITQEKVGALLYQAFDNPKKLATQASITTFFTGLGAAGLSEPVKKSMVYIKKNTQFQFGSCGKIQLSHQIKAASCLTRESRVEFQSDYKLKSMTLNFEWSL